MKGFLLSSQISTSQYHQKYVLLEIVLTSHQRVFYLVFLEEKWKNKPLAPEHHNSLAVKNKEIIIPKQSNLKIPKGQIPLLEIVQVVKHGLHKTLEFSKNAFHRQQQGQKTHAKSEGNETKL